MFNPHNGAEKRESPNNGEAAKPDKIEDESKKAALKEFEKRFLEPLADLVKQVGLRLFQEIQHVEDLVDTVAGETKRSMEPKKSDGSQ